MRWPRQCRARKMFAGRIFRERTQRARRKHRCGRQNRVVLAPVAGVKPPEVLRSPTGIRGPSIRRRRRQDEFVSGERAISRKTTAQGMPGCSGCSCMLVCVFLRTIAHETAGAASTRHSLRPLIFRGEGYLQTSGETRRENADAYSLVVTRDLSAVSKSEGGRRVTQYSRGGDD